MAMLSGGFSNFEAAASVLSTKHCKPRQRSSYPGGDPGLLFVRFACDVLSPVV
jgi:hypothetical protein